jgi:hypothetical protein
MARRHVADGGDALKIWRVAANILNKQSRQPTMGDPPAWDLGVRLTAHHHKNNFVTKCYKGPLHSSDTGGKNGSTMRQYVGYS